jgi:hypothetical protein
MSIIANSRDSRNASSGSVRRSTMLEDSASRVRLRHVGADIGRLTEVCLDKFGSPQRSIGEVRLVEDPAEIRTFFVNRPYWAYEETIETETVVHAHRNVSDLRLEIAATPPSISHTLMDVIDIDFITEGGTKRFVSELYASEEGMYHLTARLFHEQKLISSKLASCYVTPLEE